ncbi:MAG: sialidase family protein [Thermoanaerobaculia bacterium]
MLHLPLALGLTSLLLAGASGAAPLSPSESGFELVPEAAPGSLGASLTATRQGLFLSYLEPLPQGGHALRASRLEGRRWLPASTIVSGPQLIANWADFPAIAEAGDGSLVAHWLERIGSAGFDYGISLARSTDGGKSWQPLGRLNDDAVSAEHGFVSWVQEGSGLRAFWLDGREQPRGGATTLRTARVGSRVEPSQWLDERVCDCCQTSATLTDAGTLVAYRDRSAQEIRDLALGRWTGSSFLSLAGPPADRWKITACPVNGPALAARGKQVAVAWYTASQEKPRVSLAFSTDAGTTFGAPIEVDGGRPLGRLGLLLLDSGEAVVSWLAAVEGGAAVQLRRVRPDGRSGAALAVARTGTGRAGGVPRMALLADKIYLAWVDSASQPQRLRVRELAPTELPAP